MSSAPVEVACPECGAEATRQLSGGAGLLFKGSGFYLTDYGKNAHRTSGSDASKADKSDKSEKPEKSDSAAPVKSETKVDKPAPKAESKPAAKPSKPKSE
jgi:predicted nucleic acid-binding Zn ribbon protein